MEPLNNTPPRIAVTMGDPAGVGPEICLQLLQNREIESICTPTIFGDLSVLHECARRLGKELADPARVHDLKAISMDDFTPGTVNAATGRAAYTYITEAIDVAINGVYDAVTTAPINKEALYAAGIRQPGHTEIFAERTGTKKYCMMQTSEILTCSFVTVHVGYREVPEILCVGRILEVIELTRDVMRRIRGHEPKLIVCGLNPHAGENGLFGEGEEEAYIRPAVERARAAGCRIDGPLPPDTAFLEWRRKETDAVVCMYHDQGHIPIKALAFDQSVNLTLGLPIIRTSVDHGTALDIAWKGEANPSSLFEAVKLATILSADEKICT